MGHDSFQTRAYQPGVVVGRRVVTRVTICVPASQLAPKIVFSAAGYLPVTE